MINYFSLYYVKQTKTKLKLMYILVDMENLAWNECYLLIRGFLKIHDLSISMQGVYKFLKINFPEYLKIFPEFENSYRFKNNKFVNKFCSFPLCCTDKVVDY